MRLVLDARTAAFAALIDYAGLFPPASLSMEDAVREYADATASPRSWAFGRFLCPASRLEELAGVATSSFHRGDGGWSIGVVFDVDPGPSAAVAHDFNVEMSPAIEVSAAEARITDPTPKGIGELIDTIGSIGTDVVAFLEVDRRSSITRQVAATVTELASRSRAGGAKIRCGGTTADLFPNVEEVTEFIVAASTNRLAFKATAGLHQPVRHFDQELAVWRHGFVNILVADAAADDGQSHSVVEAIVRETDPAAFSIGASMARWKDVSIPGSALRRTRTNGFVAYGSCDLAEPTDALVDLGFFGEGT
ncbi:MAG: hypothetical protein ACR2N7_10125 [Acidimicrobiia bacterium]